MIPGRSVRVLALVLALVAPAGCGRGRPARDWDERWAELAAESPRWQVGAEFVLASHEGVPGGVTTTRERWQLLEIAAGEGRFLVTPDDRAPREVRRRLHPSPARVPVGPGPRRPGFRARYPAPGGLRDVRVPAGLYRCGKTVGSRTTREGPVMRVDEWWAPGVPVPVQQWERWEGQATDTLAAPPRRAADVPVGATWTVLESLRPR